jgi:hypothetical protein
MYRRYWDRRNFGRLVTLRRGVQIRIEAATSMHEECMAWRRNRISCNVVLACLGSGSGVDNREVSLDESKYTSCDYDELDNFLWGLHFAERGSMLRIT